MVPAPPFVPSSPLYPSPVSIRVLIAEDNYLVREGIRHTVEASPDLELVGACDDLPSLEAAVEHLTPQVVVTDIRMPPTRTDEGIRAAAALRHSRPETGVVVLSQYVEPEYALALLEKGAAGRAYLLKERVADLDQLANAIRQVAGGGSVIDPRVVEALVEARSRRPRTAFDELTPREREVLGKVAEGKNNAGIAAALFLSERAVEKHINSIFSKLELSEERDVHRRVKAALVYLSQDKT